MVLTYLINAKPENVERESEIVAQAGRSGAVTIATNMAGRGTDIILGGNSDYMARLKLRETLITRLVRPEETLAFSQSNQRDKQPGFSDNSAIKSFDNKSSKSLYPCDISKETDQALSSLASQLVQSWGDRTLTLIELERIATAAEKAPTEDPLINSLRKVIGLVRNEYDQVIKEDERVVREAGGLHVIGTERHESRRVDNQLRGRAGRQGDPGSTRFFLSLEDNLLRIFGGDRVAGLMNAFRVEEDMPIESGMLTRL